MGITMERYRIALFIRFFDDVILTLIGTCHKEGGMYFIVF